MQRRWAMREKLSVSDVLLLALGITLGGAGTARAILNEAGKALDRYLDKATIQAKKTEQFRTALMRLERDGLVSRNKSGGRKLTQRGRLWLEVIRRKTEYAKEQRSAQPDTVVIFDIPKRLGKRRFLLRAELSALVFEPLQRSVWIGSGPLPEAFIRFLRDTDLLSCVHIFTVKEYGTTR